VELAISPSTFHTAATCKLTSNKAVKDETINIRERKMQDFNVALLAAVFLAIENMTPQRIERIDAHIADKRSVGFCVREHRGNWCSKAPAERSLPNSR